MPTPTFTFHRLSPRERAVLSEVAKGFSDKAIGSLLNISPRTVGVHKQNIKNKLGIRNARQLFLAAFHFQNSAAQ